MVLLGTSQKRCAKLGSSIIVCFCLLFIDADSHKTPKGEGSVSVFSLFFLLLLKSALKTMHVADDEAFVCIWNPLPPCCG